MRNLLIFCVCVMSFLLSEARTIQLDKCCPMMGKISHCNKKIGRYICTNGMISPQCFCGPGEPIDMLPGQGKTSGPIPEYEKCYNENVLNTTKCQALEYRHIENLYGIEVDRVASYLSGAKKNKFMLREAEWLNYRDSYCKKEVTKDVGAMLYPILLKGCKIDLMKKRIQELKR